MYAHTTTIGGSVMERTADGTEKRQTEGSEVVEYRP